MMRAMLLGLWNDVSKFSFLDADFYDVDLIIVMHVVGGSGRCEAPRAIRW